VHIDTSKLRRGELIAIAGGLVLLIGLFIKWYESVSPLGVIAGVKGVGTYSGWDTHSIMRWFMIAAALAPLILAWIVVRDHALSWPRGEVTSIVAIAAFGLLLYNGIVDRPGEPSSVIELEWGWYVAVLGTILMLAGSFQRQQEGGGMKRKPPGVA
jgi:hypothetical protein